LAKGERKGSDPPNSARKFEKAKVALIKIGGGIVGWSTLDPGRRWSARLQPTLKTDRREAPQFQSHGSGRRRV